MKPKPKPAPATKKQPQTDVQKRLAEIAERMKTAKGKELDALTAEIDRLIEFDTGTYEPELDAEWQLAHKK